MLTQGQRYCCHVAQYLEVGAFEEGFEMELGEVLLQALDWSGVSLLGAPDYNGCADGASQGLPLDWPGSHALAGTGPCMVIVHRGGSRSTHQIDKV